MSATGIACGLNKGHIVEAISEDKHKALNKAAYRKGVSHNRIITQTTVEIIFLQHEL